jgi:hypothetical protein
LEDSLTDDDKSNRRNVQRSANTQDGEKEPKKCEGANDQERCKVNRLRPVSLNRPRKSR